MAQAALWIGLRRWPRVQLAAIISSACNPFLWRYLDEVRPYAVQYSGATVVLSCLAWLAAQPAPLIGAPWLSAFGAGLFVLCASTALGIPWAGAAVLAVLCLTWRRARISLEPCFRSGLPRLGAGACLPCRVLPMDRQVPRRRRGGRLRASPWQPSLLRL